MKEQWVRIAGVVGALVVMQSIFWEYARMHPAYGFIVTPWSIRGYETVHGWVAFFVGLASLILFLLVAWKRSESTVFGIAMVVGTILTATAIAFAAGNEDFSLTPRFALIAILGLVLARIALRLLTPVLRKLNIWLAWLIRVVIVVAGVVVVNALLGGKTLTLPPWLAILVVFVLLGALSLAAEPRQLGANRILMFSSIAGAFALAVSAGAVRSTLIRFQQEGDGVAAQYVDTQVTSGHLMSVLGMVLVFLAAVALWGRRRDALINAARVRSQREAAEASAREIAAAQEGMALRT